MNVLQTKLGYEIRWKNFLILMGNAQSNWDSIRQHYSEITFVRVKQIHSDAIVESPDNQQDYQIIADAHYTSRKNLGLCVSTADCIPAFIFHDDSPWVAGIHAGWRGVANRILPKSIDKMQSLGLKPADMQVYLGPHIQKKSFTVGLDVRDQILTSLGAHKSQDFCEYTDEQHCLVDLNAVAQKQCALSGVPNENIHALAIDTFKDTAFHSHRRDREKAGRQLSFICRLD